MAVYPSNMARTPAKLWENAFQTIPDVSFFDVGKIFSTTFLDRDLSFSLILWVFGGARAKRTSPSTSTSNFALEPPILRSVRLKIIENMFVLDLT